MMPSRPAPHKNGLMRLGSSAVARILFVMPEVGYLRIYGTTVRALASRGHEVRLAYNKPAREDRDEGALRDAADTLSTIGVVPEHGGPWRGALIELGCTIDYVRFMSRSEGTPYLRGRMERYLPTRAIRLRDVGSWPASLVRGLASLATLTERAVPVDSVLTDFLRDQSPDAMVITPLVLRGPGGVQQTQLVKAARVLGIPVGLAVASWDHLSSKGLIRVDPDAVIVWNDVQKREAIEMHRVPASRVTVTGAQLFDLWFGRAPSLDRDTFLARVGLPSDRPVVLYAGSSRGIANPQVEIPFVKRWLDAIRGSTDPVLRTASVLVRPHISNVTAWSDVELSALGPVSVWPRRRPVIPMNDLETSDYFHSLYHSAAVVGINTSAMIESVIIDRPVLTVELPEFASTQAGTTHFHYLVPTGGGPIESSGSLGAHVEQLSRVLADPQHGRQARAQFVATFVRPLGVERPALDAVVEAIERLTQLHPRPMVEQPAWLAPARWWLKWATASPPAG